MPTPDERLDRLIEALGAEAASGEAVARGAGGRAAPHTRAPAASPAPPGPGPDDPTHDGVPDGRHRPQRTPLLSLPSSLRGATVGVGGPVLRGMVVLVVVLAAVLGVRVAWAERSATPRPVPAAGQSDLGAATASPDPGEAGLQAPTSGATAEPAAVPTTSATQPEVVVHVIGAVREPGVVTITAGARVQDAVEAAGGLLDEADLARLNLARPAVDGERLWVPVPGEEPPPELPVPQPVATPGIPGAEVTGGADAGGLVDLNTADQAELETLPGVGPVTAERILQWRAEHGAFTTVEELVEVSGIGERTLEQLRPHVGLGP